MNLLHIKRTVKLLLKNGVDEVDNLDRFGKILIAMDLGENAYNFMARSKPEDYKTGLCERLAKQNVMLWYWVEAIEFLRQAWEDLSPSRD